MVIELGHGAQASILLGGAAFKASACSPKLPQAWDQVPGQQRAGACWGCVQNPKQCVSTVRDGISGLFGGASMTNDIEADPYPPGFPHSVTLNLWHVLEVPGPGTNHIGRSSALSV